MKVGYEDWEFWLRLGAQGRFGRYVPKPLFRYRKRWRHRCTIPRSPVTRSWSRTFAELHPELYEYETRARIKARWSPAVSIIAVDPPGNQTIEDIEVIAPGKSPLAPAVLSAIDRAAGTGSRRIGCAGALERIRLRASASIRSTQQITPAFAQRRAALVCVLDPSPRALPGSLDSFARQRKHQRIRRAPGLRSLLLPAVPTQRRAVRRRRH